MPTWISWRIDHVVVVEDQDDVVGQRVELVEQRRQDRLDRPVGRLEERQRRRADAGHRRLQRGDQVRPERLG